MAGLRNGAVMALLVVAVAFLASSVAVGAADEAFTWDDFIAYNQQQYASQQAAAIEGDVDAAATSKFPPIGPTLVVDIKGSGDYKTIQAAIDSIPKGNTKRYILYIKNGVYKQKLTIVAQKSNIYLKCQSKNVVITYGDTAEKAGGTALSASVAVESAGFIMSDCTVQNSAPAPPGGAVGKQAVALRIQGDKGAFYRCSFLGAQDTLYDKAGRHYFRSCEIVGSIDFIFGDGQSFYHKSWLTSIAKAGSGSLTAQKRESNSKTGFVFYHCSIGGSGMIYLGRAWGTHSRVIFYECNIANMIRPEGWQDWNDPARRKTIFYAEYNCYGPGASRVGREKWSKVLTYEQAKPFGSIGYINGYDWLQGPL